MARVDPADRNDFSRFWTRWERIGPQLSTLEGMVSGRRLAGLCFYLDFFDQTIATMMSSAEGAEQSPPSVPAAVLAAVRHEAFQCARRGLVDQELSWAKFDQLIAELVATCDAYRKAVPMPRQRLGHPTHEQLIRWQNLPPEVEAEMLREIELERALTKRSRAPWRAR